MTSDEWLQVVLNAWVSRMTCLESQLYLAELAALIAEAGLHSETIVSAFDNNFMIAFRRHELRYHGDQRLFKYFKHHDAFKSTTTHTEEFHLVREDWIKTCTGK